MTAHVAKKILVVLGDLGSASDLVPVIQSLQDLGHAVTVYADPLGKGMDLLMKEGIPFTAVDHDAQLPKCQVVLIGTSASANFAQRTMTLAAREAGVPCVWFEDFHGTSNAVPEVHPDCLLVVDDMALSMVRNERPRQRAQVVGKPSFREFREPLADREAFFARTLRVSHELDLTHRDVVVTYCSGGEDDERVRVQLAALASLPAMIQGVSQLLRLVVIPRIHPKVPNRDRLLAEMTFGEAHVIRADTMSFLDLHAATDIFVCDWGSTQGIISALIGTQTVVTLFPQDLDRRVARGHVGGTTPLMQAGACQPVYNADSLLYEILSFTSNQELQNRRLHRNAHHHFGALLKGDSVQVIIDAVLDEIAS